jgi:catechol 2,3-dioxygenase-like lactoylglutathione lyase family enzyme
MKFRLDHVVIAVADLGKAVEGYRALGFTVVIGGRHPGRTSHNALVALQDGAYLELIAWTAPGPGERWYDVHAKHGDGLMDFALLPEDTAQAIAEAKARGLALDGPIDGGRVRPDGTQIQWQTGRQSTFDLPFLCGDVTPRALRVPEGEARKHPNGVVGVKSVTVAVHDLDATLTRYAALLGHGADEGGEEVERAESGIVLPASGVRVAFVALEGTRIVLLSPSKEGAGSSSRLADMLHDRLATRGEGPCAMALRAGPGRSALALDPELSRDRMIDIRP